jgi:hypothetical protein
MLLCPYSVPKSLEQQLYKEIARLVSIGEDYTSEWASPTFAIVNKNGTIRVVSDCRNLISSPYLNVTHFQEQRSGT